MTTYERCCAIRRMIINIAAEVMAYDNWSSDFAASQIRKFPKELAKGEGGKNYFEIQPSEMNEEQLKDLGFGRWSDETPMHLIPLWLFPFLADGIEVETITGKKKVFKKSEMDNDNRYGCLAYGITPAKT